MGVFYKYHVTEQDESIYFTSKYYIPRVPVPLSLKQSSHFFNFVEEK
jgi:hypothetical protein